MQLDGAKALVTGGSSGIGQAVVERLGASGATVAVLDLDARDGQGDLAVACDLSDEQQVVDAVRHVHHAFDRLDVAVLNAGTGGFSPIVDMSAAEWDRVMNINLRGTFLSLREVAKAMIDGGRGGSVVVTSSISGFLAERGMAHYNASKGAVNQLVRVAARELGPFGIRVNAVAPGATDTPLFAQTKGLPGYWDRLSERTPVGDVGTSAQIAEAVAALVGLDWVTGAVLTADGGVSLWSPIDPMEGF